MKAQFVAIPDPNFVSYLQANFPLAMSGNQLDTTHTSVLSCTVMACGGNGISNLYGVQFFDNLTSLNCASNSLSTIPALPANLHYLSIENNSVTSLSTLPSSLTTLVCASNQLSALPTLPSTLTKLDCSHNQLSVLPSLITTSLIELNCKDNLLTSLPALPNSLLRLFCSNNQLSTMTSLPTGINNFLCRDNLLSILPSLPDSLIFFDCGKNQLSSLPLLPAKITMLQCDSNLLSALPSIPDTTYYIQCSNNLLTSLPFVMNTRLTQLYCGHNQLSLLPNLPETIYKLDCPFNQLTSLPYLPYGLTSPFLYLICNDNPGLYCLPKLRSSMNTLMIDNTSITCLPNLVNVSNTAASTIGVASFPLCTAASGCNLYWNISGQVHSDTSVNCVLDSLNPGNRLSKVKVQLLKNNIVQEQTYTNNNGEFSFNTGNNDTLDVRIDTTGLPFNVACPTTFSHHLLLSPLDSLKDQTNFGIECNGIDAGVRSIQGRFRPSQLRRVRILAGDIHQLFSINCGYSSMSGIVTTTLNGPVQYIQPAIGALIPSSVSGNALEYFIADFNLIQADSAFNIMVKTDSNAAIGTQICIKVSISNVTGDVRPSNDSLMQCFNVVNSLDPNEKEVYPKAANAGDWLTYTIHFQNTGNDTAYTVVIKDTLSNNLDVNSFTYIASSHTTIAQLSSNRVTFTFPHINLLDSVNHEPESHGWVQYKIKLKNGLSAGEITNNQASIYFDTNPPIQTNIASNLIGIPSSLVEQTNLQSLLIYPNPTNGEFVIHTSLQGEVFCKIFTLDGRLIQTMSFKSQVHWNALKQLSKGIYVIEVDGTHGEKQIRKLIISE